ncbi:DUF4157 domain-containing protein [Actinomadura decatromicini]|uniref:DUF4157 domain-containing protein n=1 Tax=Actinomadura decatromicini TaxID=2604572 RepID=A0A5D3FM47_9ACTN|nr:DUF4157 domain-containing protein [Actinomadura decatromicini]TYK49381.1 DUF4157 domain-containing protein [Actinomadura decatromicini]
MLHARKPDERRADRSTRVPPRSKNGEAFGPAKPSHRAIAELQGLAGNTAVARVIQSARDGCGPAAEQTVQRSQVDEVLRTPGRPLDAPLRAEMEARMGADFSDVRLHTGTAAERSAAEIGASAYTSGSDVVIGKGGVDKHTLAHELTHVIQQRRGPVAGTDNGDGLKLSDPSDRFEREAELNAARVMGGQDPAAEAYADGEAAIARKPAAYTASVQRYHVVEPGAADYPSKWRKRKLGPSEDRAGDEEFFIRQGVNANGSYYDSTDPPEPHLLYEGAVSLAISDNFDLAAHDPVDGAEAKHFFATEAKIKEANDLLGDSGGRVRLTKTGKYLRIEGGGREKRLFEVMPDAQVPGTGGARAKGLDARAPQRCNAMAQFVTGSHNITMGTTRYFKILGGLVDELAPGNNFEDGITAAMNQSNRAAYDQLSQAMSRAFQDLMRDNPEQVENTLRRLGFNEFAPAPDPGQSISTIGYGDAEQEAERARKWEGFEYHFGGVVAKSGTDYITMENYARGELRDTLDSGDPLWYFRMYGAATPLQSWHRGWFASGQFRGAVLTIVLEH